MTLTMLLGTAPAAARADAVDCSNADDFCTGDPCTVTARKKITVPSCVLDFGGRALRIDAHVFVPNAGRLDLRAATIAVNARIRGAHTRPADADGADVSLTATAGDIVIGAPLDVSAWTTNGRIALDAAGGIDLQSRLRARAKGAGATATGGDVILAADGLLTSTNRGRVDVRGKRKATPAGLVTLTGATGVAFRGRVLAGGSAGGTVVIASSTGEAIIEEELRAQGEAGNGGSVVVSAPAGGVVFGGVKGNARVDGSPGGSITITAGGAVSLRRGARARGLGATSGGAITITSTGGDITYAGFFAEGRYGGTGGTVVLAAAGTVTGNGPIQVEGALMGGVVQVSAMADAVINRRIEASGDEGAGGVIEVSAVGDTVINSGIGADGNGAGNGGCIKVASLGAGAEINAKLEADSEAGAGGRIVVEGAAGVTINDGREVSVDGGPSGSGGSISITGALLTLAGDLHANGDGGAPGGVIDARASAALTTCGGDFRATPSGCIALSPLDPCGTFDPSPVPGCAPAPTTCPF